jgi:hypothetical protein
MRITLAILIVLGWLSYGAYALVHQATDQIVVVAERLR